MHPSTPSENPRDRAAGAERPRGADEITGARPEGHRPGPAHRTDPLRHPEASGALTRTKRAWLLLLLTAVLPGSVQLLIGNRRLGWRALGVTLTVWGCVLAALILLAVHRSWLFSLVTSRFTSLVLIVVLAVLALGWALLFLDALRLIRPALLARGMRPMVALGCAGLMLATAGTLGYSAYLVGVGRGALGNVFSGGSGFEAADGRYNILLMGGDAGADRVGRRPDSMTVFSIDAKTGQAVTISLPRNLQNAPFAQGSPLWQVWPEGFDCGDECILNALYPQVAQEHADLYPDAADPGAEAMKDAAEGITGLRIQAYALVDMDGFADLVDALGGIELDVGGRVPIGGGTNEITGEKNPIDGWIEPGRQHLDGFHALWYARSREGASDFEREARQRCVQSAMLAQLDPANVLTKFRSITDAGQQIVETDIPEAQLGEFADLGLKAKDHELIQYGAGPPYWDDMFPTYPDYDAFRAGVAQVIEGSAEGKTPTPAADDAQAAGPAGVVSAVRPAALLATLSLLPGAGSVQAQDGPAVSTVAELGPNGTCSVP
ncbi:LCP family protein [Rothia kristinae]|uniref:LCP family protein n=1 Tax=Rothia kristinae TaxID=37923 RepID=UPI00119CD185|nr:LCP family protein [Rothia kristinae]